MKRSTVLGTARKLWMAGLAMATLTMAIGCQSSPPEPAEYTDVEEVTATVTAIDLGARMITLRGPGGDERSFALGESVRNLSQVEVGDRVTLGYYAGVAAEVTEADPDEEVGVVDVVTARAPPGERPAGMEGTEISAVVIVEDVDTRRNTVTFHGADGVVRTIDVRRPEMQTFISRLRKGDKVRVTFSEAVAVRVEPSA